MEKTRKTIGLALGSGGVRGLAHVGVIGAFVKNNIPIDFIAGSSIGAWASAHYALYKDIESLKEITIGQKREKLMALLELTLKGGFVKGNKQEKFLKKFFLDTDFESTQIPLRVVATNLATGESVVLSQGKIAPAVRASMAVPTIFKPTEIAGQLLLDGGLTNPVPDDVVRAMGADIVVAVNLNGLPAGPVLSGDELKLTGVTLRSLDIMRHHLARYSLNTADIIIEPQLVYAGLKTWREYFTKEIGSDFFEAGEKEVTAILPQIKKLLDAD